MPFCARCLGAVIGHVLSFLLLVLGALPSLWIAAMMAGLMLLDWGLQEGFGVMSTNPRRLATGVLGGAGVGIFYWVFLRWMWFIAVPSTWL